MSALIPTVEGGFVAPSAITRLVPRHGYEDYLDVYVAGERASVGTIHRVALDCVGEIVPAVAAEVVLLLEEEDGTPTLQFIPVIAWTKTLAGALRPVLADSLRVVPEQDYGLRAKGDTRIYFPVESVGPFTEAEFVAFLVKRQGGGQ